MSRIPVPSHSSAHDRALSPVPFPERAASPLPPLSSRLNSSTTSTSMSTVSFGSGTIADTRKKQSKKDEAIRKKIESELARKRTISTTQIQRKGRGKPPAAKGTVAALKPSPALTVPEGITVSDASQLCAAKRTDCVLVVDEDEGLSGIFTAKDLAYRVSAEGIDPRNTPVSAIMTRSPMVTRDTTSATEALQLMVQRHFRHLPVCNEEGNVVGLLDINKVFQEALDKLERSSSASEKLYSALAGVQSELGHGMATNPQAAAMLSYVEALREKTALPDLTTIMDSRTHPATVGPKTTVREAARLMKEHRTTAVCVMESGGAPGAPPRIAGIFTSKDVVLRVIAAGLDPARCSVVRVMTPHPDCVNPTITIMDALKKMHRGRYLNLPVIEEDGRLVAIVDVLKLTYAMLEQMNQMTAEASGGGDNANGPMWGRFFESLGAHDDAESAISGSNIPTHTDLHTPDPHADSPLRLNPHSPEVHPNDSASVIDDDRSDVDAVRSIPALRRLGTGRVPSLAGSAMRPPPTEADDGTYVFKFSTPSRRTHRFQARHDDFDHLRDVVVGKLAADPFFVAFQPASEDGTTAAEGPNPDDFTMYYKDADGDNVYISSGADVIDAVKSARDSGVDRVVLFLHGGDSWPTKEEPSAASTENKSTPVTQSTKSVSDEASTIVTTTPSEQPTTHSDSAPAKPFTQPHQQHPVYIPSGGDDVFGVPRDLILPASIGALAVVIIAVFTISRFSD